MEEDQELLKRYIDCVYFLASPLTCKKGIECEYRHNEIARLNPRDCWYWLAGSCFNATCAFRHPPLDGHIEMAPESAFPHNCGIPLKKTNAPCYFYFNGYCNKGEQCSFMHGHCDGKFAQKSAQTASTVIAEVVDKKLVTRSDSGSAPTETKINTAEPAVKGSTEPATKGSTEPVSKAKQEFQQLASFDVVDKSVSPCMSASECEEEAFVRSESLPSEEGFVESQSPTCIDQSSEEQVACHPEQEEWCESSPGLDVLVDDKSDDADFEDGPEYLSSVDFERMELNGQFLSYAHENPVDCDPAYLAANIFHDQEFQDAYDHLDDKHYSEYTRSSKQPKLRVFDRLSLQKGNFSRMELTHSRRSMDLRNHLNRQRLVDSHSVPHSSESCSSARLIGRSRERPISRGSQHSHRKLALGVEKKILKSGRDDRILPNVVNKKQRVMDSGVNHSWQYKENRLGKLQFSSGVGMNQPVSKIHRSASGSSMFTGPKTLDLIKEERKRGHKTGDTSRRKRHYSRTSSEDFQGPKSLSAILKDKRRLVSVIGDDSN